MIEYRLLDILLAILYFIFIMVWATWIRQKNVKDKPEYAYFSWALLAKLFGAIGVCLIYTLYYSGGDTTLYFESSKVMLRLAEKDMGMFLDVFLGERNAEHYSYFTNETGWPNYYHDGHSFFVVKLMTIVTLIGGQSFISTALVLAFISFAGIWRLYQVLHEYYPDIRKHLAISVLFIPSVVFWGSGILKDTITFSCVGWYTYSFYYLMIRRRIRPSYATQFILASVLLIAIKPYIFFAILPGSMIWFAGTFSSRIQSTGMRLIFTPSLALAGLFLGYIILENMQDQLGVYKFESILEKAVVSQRDQKQEYYGGNSFDIGDFDPNIPSMLSVSHKGVFAGLFRPSLLDVRNIVMFMSALENTYLLILAFFLLLRLKFFGFFRFILKDPMLLFCVLFALFFAFSIGLSTSNFGTLVRLKIPCIPFFVSALFVIRHYYEKASGTKLGV